MFADWMVTVLLIILFLDIYSKLAPPEMKFGWKIVVGSIVGFLGAALGSVGCGGIFVPMLALIIGFDPKSSTAISKCSTVYFNLRLRHPTLDMPLYRLWSGIALPANAHARHQHRSCLQCHVRQLMVTVLFIILFLGTAAKALMKVIETWKKETMMKKEAEKQLESESKSGIADGSGEDYKLLPSGPASLPDEVPISHNVYWKDLLMLVYVRVAFLIVQIVKVPIAISIMFFEAKFLCKGTRVIASKGKEITNWKLHQIFPYSSCVIVAGLVGSLLVLGGGFILGPRFLELGIPPQPMLMLGISIGVVFKVRFAHWMVTVLLIILFLGSRKAVGIGVQTWRWFHCKMSRYLYHTIFTGRSYRCITLTGRSYRCLCMSRYQLQSTLRSLKLYAYAKAPG